MKSPEVKHTPMWRKSMLQRLNLYEIQGLLQEIYENGDMYGYENGDESEYYYEYKELFDELADGAYEMSEALYGSELVRENWDDMTVTLLGSTHKVLGYDVVREDYFDMIDRYDEEFAQEVAERRIEKLTKKELIGTFGRVMTTLVLFFDIKAAHDSLCAVVEELDSRGAILNRMIRDSNERVAKVGETYDTDDAEFDKLVASLPPRAWVE